MSPDDEEWLSFREAVEIVRRRLNIGVGRAEKIVRDARASGEVRSYYWDRYRDPLMYHPKDEDLHLSKDDFVNWLDQQTHQKQQATKQKKYRHPGDAKLIAEARGLVATGMSKLQAAERMAPRAEGGSIDQRTQRLRKLI